MPKGHHYGRTQTRAYTDGYRRIYANVFKSLLTTSLGKYSLDGGNLSNEHRKLELIELDNNLRVMVFTINNTPHQIALKLDNSSVSNKLYITCPYCQKRRQHLYVIKTAYVCRQCIGLHYASQSEGTQTRLIRRIRTLRKELWGYDWPEVNNMFENITYWPKPKWMRWKTFENKRKQINELEEKYWPMAAAQMKKTFGEYYLVEY